MNLRKIASNYIFLPGFSLIKNGYVVLSDRGVVDVVETGGEIKEIAGLEFYGGLIVPEYICENAMTFSPGKALLPVLEMLFQQTGQKYTQLAIIEGADLKALTWRIGAHIRRL